MARRLEAAGLLLAFLAMPSLAAAPTDAQKAEFYSVCIAISGNQPLCTCKADAAVELIDKRFMDVVISSMQGGAPAAADYAAYNTYIARSNRICKPNY